MKNQVNPNTKSEVEENPAISPAPKELAALNSKIITIEQSLSQLVDKIANMETRINLLEEVTNKITNMETRIKFAEEVNNRVTMLEGRVEKQQIYIRLQFDSNDNRICKLWESLGREEHSASQFQDKTDKKLMELENKLTTAAARQRDGASSNLKSKFFRPK